MVSCTLFSVGLLEVHIYFDVDIYVDVDIYLGVFEFKCKPCVLMH